MHVIFTILVRIVTGWKLTFPVWEACLFYPYSVYLLRPSTTTNQTKRFPFDDTVLSKFAGKTFI